MIYNVKRNYMKMREWDKSLGWFTPQYLIDNKCYKRMKYFIKRIGEGESYEETFIGFKHYPYKNYRFKGFKFSINLRWWVIKIILW